MWTKKSLSDLIQIWIGFILHEMRDTPQIKVLISFKSHSNLKYFLMSAVFLFLPTTLFTPAPGPNRPDSAPHGFPCPDPEWVLQQLPNRLFPLASPLFPCTFTPIHIPSSLLPLYMSSARRTARERARIWEVLFLAPSYVLTEVLIPNCSTSQCFLRQVEQISWAGIWQDITAHGTGFRNKLSTLNAKSCQRNLSRKEMTNDTDVMS